MMRRYAQLPDPPSGAALDDVFSIVVPMARTNLVTNPSLETATTGWAAAVGGETLARTTAQQYHGAYSLSVTPTANTVAGCSYSTVSLTAGTTYAVSCKFLGNAGLPFRLLVTDNTGATVLATYTFRATGRWQWIWLYYTETASTTRRIYITKNGSASVAPFYVDGVQCEALGSLAETVSTYIDGDQQGLVTNQQPPAYLWTGTPHASTSSRSGLTRAGGMVVKFKDYNFFLTAIIGLGLALPQNVKTEYARLDGAFDDYTRKPTRQFTLTGQFQGRSYQELRGNRSGIAQLLDRDLVGLDQRMTLLHHIEGPCGDTQTNESRVLCKYQGGLDGNTDNQALENAAASFEQYLPYVVSDGEQGSSLSVQQNVTNAARVLLRSPSGQWSAIGTGATSTVRALTFGKIDEYLYLGGPFGSLNGIANTNHIARYSMTAGTVSAMGTGVSIGTSVDALATGPDGHVWAVGAFNQMGGVANTAFFAEWDGSAWSGHSYPGTGTTTCIAVGPNGTVYVGSDSGQVHSWNGSAWTLLGTVTGGVGANVLGIAFGPDNNLYIIGDFTSVTGPVAVDGAARYTLSSSSPVWQTLGTPPASQIWLGLAFAPNGQLYVGGANAAATTADFYRYNGVSWTQLTTFTALTGTAKINWVQALPNGQVYFAGQFSAAGGIAYPDSFGLWTGATAIPADVDLPGSAEVSALAARSDGTLAVGYNTSGTAVAAGITTVTNTGTGKAYPTLRITGPTSGTSRIYQIVNYTTGQTIYLNYTISAGEVAIFQFTPDNLSFQSSFVGNLASSILPSSAEANFFLQPGANIISFYAADSSVVAALYWRPAFVSLDDVK